MSEQQRLVAHAPQRRSTATIVGLDMQYRYTELTDYRW